MLGVLFGEKNEGRIGFFPENIDISKSKLFIGDETDLQQYVHTNTHLLLRLWAGMSETHF